MMTLQELLEMQIKGRKIRYMHEIYISEEIIHDKETDLYFLNLRSGSMRMQVPKSAFEHLELVE